MSGEDSDTFSLLRQSVRQFIEKEVMPVSQKIDKEDYFPLDLFRKMGKMGFLGVTIPPEYGGSGMDYTAQAIIEEELGYASASLALSYGAHSNLCLDNLYRNGSEQQKEEYVPKLARGDWIGSLALTEPGSGSDALAMRTSAEIQNGTFVLNGSKTLITNAPYSDVFLTYARTGDSYSAFVVLSEDNGFSRGKKFDKMGMRGSPTGEIFFDNVKVPESRLVGNLNGGKDIILSGLNVERVILSFIFVGLARRALELSVKYATERKQSGNYLHEFEMIQDKLAVMYTKYQTSRLMADRALNGIKEDNMNVMDAAAAIYHVAESAEYIAREAVQIHGGIGYVREGEVERLLRDAILGQIGAGTTEIRKKLIAQGLVKKYKKQGRISD
ncbi:isovaleryl-CoA dehydrogenase [uncultured archaeon]|nr:isovaleryl-CoA dehydrogenase [uncultured archaeon]